MSVLEDVLNSCLSSMLIVFFKKAMNNCGLDNTLRSICLNP